MAEAEKSLIEKVELRIALANTSEKFESSLKLYLAPLILKFASPHPQVRVQIAKTTKYLITRVNSNNDVKLPIDALLNQVKTPNVPEGSDPTVVQSYTLLFISKGLSRLSDIEKHELVPKLIQGISSLSPLISARLFNILCKLLPDFKYPIQTKDDEASYRSFLGFKGFEVLESDEKFLINKFFKFMILLPVQSNDQGVIPKGISLPGLSKDDVAFFTYDAGVTFDSHTLTNYKKHILKFIEYGFHKDSCLILIVATADSATAISDLATTLLKRRSIDNEDPFVTDSLISLFVGDLADSRPPAKLQLQEKIVNYCTQSKRAALSSEAGKLSSIGLNSDYQKLKQATIRFIKWVTTVMTSESIDSQSDFNFTMAAQLKSNLQAEKQLDTNTNFNTYLLQRRYQYEALGLMLRRSPKLDDLGYIEFLFGMLQTDLVELRSTIQEALSGLMPHLTSLPVSNKAELKVYLKNLIEASTLTSETDSSDACCYMGIKFVNCSFPFSDPESRLLNILVQTKKNVKPDTLEEASRGLHPYWFGLLQSSNSTDFKSSSEVFSMNAQSKLEFPSFQNMVKQLLSFTSNGLNIDIGKSITFIMRCLVMQAIKGKETVVVSDQEWETRLDKSLEFDETVVELLSKELIKQGESALDVEGDLEMVDFEQQASSALDMFINVMIDHFISTMDLTSGKYLAKMLSLSNDETLSKFVPKIPQFIELIPKMVSIDGCLYIAKIVGLLCVHKSYSDKELKTTLLKLIDSEEILSLGFIISRMVLSERTSIISSELYESVLDLLETVLNTASSRKLYFAIESLSQLCMFGSLGPTLQFSDKVDQYRKSFTTKLQPLVKKSDERAIMAWAYLGFTSASLAEPDELTSYENLLFEAHSVKQADFLFTSGEALTVLASGWKSSMLSRKIEVEFIDKKPAVSEINRLPVILDYVLKATKNSKPSLRKASCIWLLSLVQYCANEPIIKERVSELQVAFMRFLSDNDDLVQESASRGLAAVYGTGDSELKDTLVHNLLLSFTDANKTSSLISGSIGEETELFQPGVLNTESNSGGSSVSTYKDVLNLASEVGDPSLVYKFMSLAKSSALWSSRKGIAFGLGAILDKTKLDSLISSDEKLSRRLIPKLFRYRFDPAQSVSRTMNEIWSTLILDPSKTIKDNFDIILKELLGNMSNREWRVRQASTTALQDLLRYSTLEQYEDKLEEIWTKSFRVMDDIKESVRKEGNSLTRYLASTMVTKISNNNGIENSEKSKAILNQLIPFLLGYNGLLSESEDVKKFAFDTILKLCNTSSLALKPFVNEMIEQMIVLMSSIEPQVINYITLNADKYNMKSDDIDSQRLNMVGNSPMMEAIEKLMNLLDDSMMEDFLTHLSDAVKKSVGLPSKVTGSRVLVNLITRHIFICSNHGDKLLKIANSQLKDRNLTVAKSYAISIGYISRIASIKKLSSLSKKLITYYFEDQDGNNNRAKLSAITSEAISRYSKDKFQSIASLFLPISFLGKHDTRDKETSKIFNTEWTDSTPNSASGIKLYLTDIIELIDKHINTSNFQLRQTIGLSIIEIVDKLGKDLNNQKKYLPSLYNILIESLKGRSFEGKEKLLDSLVLLSINSESFLISNDEVFSKVCKCVLTEAKRKNKKYLKYSIKSLGKFLGTFPDVPTDYIDSYLETIDNLIFPEPKDEDDSDMDIDDEDDRDDQYSKKIKLEEFENFQNSILENLIISINKEQPNLKIIDYLISSINKVFDVSVKGDDLTYRTKLVGLNLITQLINKLITTPEDSPTTADGSSLTTALKKDDQTHVFNSIFDTFKNISAVCVSKDNLQNVLVSCIRLDKLAVAKLLYFDSDPEKRKYCVDLLNGIYTDKVNSVVSREAEKALDEITK